MTDSKQSGQPPASALGRDRSAFERFFPGPTRTDPQFAQRLEGMRQAAERRAEATRNRAAKRADSAGSRAGQPALPLAATEDLDRLVDALHEQTDVMRALLDADTAIRDDARSTAQNTRTFAIAGTAIAFFTLVATVVTIVIAIAH